jgi:hypothetical protein
LGPQIANPQIAKIYGLQIVNPQITPFSEGVQTNKNLSLQMRICDLRNLFADRPPLHFISYQQLKLFKSAHFIDSGGTIFTLDYQQMS